MRTDQIIYYVADWASGKSFNLLYRSWKLKKKIVDSEVDEMNGGVCDILILGVL